MPNSPILSIPQVATNQNQKETTINTAVAILEAACNSEKSYSSTGNQTISTTNFTRYFHHVFTGHTAAREVTFPDTARFVAVTNDGAYNLTFKTAGVGDDAIVEPGKRALLLSDGVNVVAVSSGVTLLSSLTDVSGAGSPAGGQILVFDDGSDTWGPVDNFSEHSFYFEGAPNANERVYRHVFTRSERLFSDFTGSQGYADVNAAASETWEVYKNSTLVGTFKFNSGTNTAIFTTDTGSGSSTVSFAPGDRLTIEAPAYPDPSLVNIAVTLKGVYL